MRYFNSNHKVSNRNWQLQIGISLPFVCWALGRVLDKEGKGQWTLDRIQERTIGALTDRGPSHPYSPPPFWLTIFTAINWGTNYLGSSGLVTCRHVTRLFVSALMWLNNKTCSSTQAICSFKHPICLKGTGFNLALSVCRLLHGQDSFMTLSLLLSALPQNHTVINPHVLPWHLSEYIKACRSVKYFALSWH